jgi:hypothetical protein
MSRLVQLVADYGRDDLAYAELLQRLALAVPDVDVHLTAVAPCDTVAAGFCVARLALTAGPPGRVVAHDIGAADGERMCAGCTRGGTWIVGPNTGWAWSFVAEGLTTLCRVDVTGGGAREGLPVAIAHVIRRHPHALCGVVPRTSVPPVPQCVVAHVAAAGDITTTVAEPPGVVGTGVRVRIGEVTARAVVADATREPPNGQLAIAVGTASWPTRAGGQRSFVGLSVGGGSAAELFAEPRPGTAVDLRAIRARRSSGGRNGEV